MKPIFAALLVGALTACGDDDETPASCAEVDPTSCDATDGCTSIWARPVEAVGEGWCVDYSADSVPLGCMDADVGCGGAESPATTADDPDSCLWLFPSTCLPDGYQACPESALPECG